MPFGLVGSFGEGNSTIKDAHRYWCHGVAFHDQLPVLQHGLDHRFEAQFVHQDNVVDITRDNFLGNLTGGFDGDALAADVGGNP